MTDATAADLAEAERLVEDWLTGKLADIKMSGRGSLVAAIAAALEKVRQDERKAIWNAHVARCNQCDDQAWRGCIAGWELHMIFRARGSDAAR